HDREQLVLGALLGHWSAPGLSGATPIANDLVQLLAKTQTTVVTSLAAPWGNLVLFRQVSERRNDPLLAALTSAAERSHSPDWARSLTPELRQQAYDRTVGGFQLAHHGDVRIAVGSGTPDADCFYGHCLHTELWHLAHAGLTPLQILRQATLGNAEALGTAEHFGSLAPGKFADLVLLDKDPLVDIHNTLSIAYVVSEGRTFQRGAPLHIAPPPSAVPKDKL
ncbi:MAG TPA: amidohydrolase family protein, partial [Polyangiaceae bacterium]